MVTADAFWTWWVAALMIPLLVMEPKVPAPLVVMDAAETAPAVVMDPKVPVAPAVIAPVTPTLPALMVVMLALAAVRLDAPVIPKLLKSTVARAG
jgi:hypothetical protein